MLFGLVAVLLLGGASLLLLKAPPEQPTSEQPALMPLASETPVERNEPATPEPSRAPTRETRQLTDPAAETLAELSEIAAKDYGSLHGRLAALLAGDDLDRMAALRFLAQGHLSDPVPLLAQTIGDPEASPAVRSMALAQLESRARLDPRAQDGLCAFLALKPTDPEERSLAFGRVLRFGRDTQLQSGLALLLDENDVDVAVAAAVELKANDAPGARSRLEALGWKHPDPEVRKRLRALGLGR